MDPMEQMAVHDRLADELHEYIIDTWLNEYYYRHHHLPLWLSEEEDILSAAFYNRTVLGRQPLWFSYYLGDGQPFNRPQSPTGVEEVQHFTAEQFYEEIEREEEEVIIDYEWV